MIRTVCGSELRMPVYAVVDVDNAAVKEDWMRVFMWMTNAICSI